MRRVTWRLRAILPLILVPSIGLFILVHVSHDDLTTVQEFSRSRQVKRRVLETDTSGGKVARDAANQDARILDAIVEAPYTERISNDKFHKDEDKQVLSGKFTEPLLANASLLSKSLLRATPAAATATVCDAECIRLRTVLASWPANKPKAAIYFLTQSQRWNFLAAALASLDQYFNNQYKYPIIIFHEEEFITRWDDVIKLTTSDIYFQTVSFSIPDFLDKPVPVKIPCTSSISYRHMCRFHAKTVYELPILHDLQYYWRLDDDSVLLANISYDVFQFMEANNYQYGYIWRHLDAYSCVHGLWESTRQYIDAKNLSTYSFSTWKRPWLYYNNFEISATRTWMSEAYRDYIEYIDRLGGIYFHRWGDAPIRGIAVSMYIPQTQVHLFDDIAYQHRTFVHDAKT